MGRFPETGESLRILSYETRGTSTDGRRVGQIHFRKTATADGGIGDEKSED